MKQTRSLWRSELVVSEKASDSNLLYSSQCLLSTEVKGHSSWCGWHRCPSERTSEDHPQIQGKALVHCGQCHWGSRRLDSTVVWLETLPAL